MEERNNEQAYILYILASIMSIRCFAQKAK
jgi:hypothetical protein